MTEIYAAVGKVVWWLAFACGWIYAVSAYGFLWGLGLGWLPAAILATIVALLWPLALAAAIGLGILFFGRW